MIDFLQYFLDFKGSKGKIQNEKCNRKVYVFVTKIQIIKKQDTRRDKQSNCRRSHTCIVEVHCFFVHSTIEDFVTQQRKCNEIAQQDPRKIENRYSRKKF